jgi:ArsR family transcriptional regulator
VERHGLELLVSYTESESQLAQSTVSKHLASLRDCQLVDFRMEGRQSFYSVAQPALQDPLAAAEQLLEATGRR